jgi:hypothetical protein
LPIALELSPTSAVTSFSLATNANLSGAASVASTVPSVVTVPFTQALKPAFFVALL